jgi:hypothetical protein
MAPNVGPVPVSDVQVCSCVLDKLTHAVGSINLGKFHATNDHARDNLTSVLDNSILGKVHVQTTHASELLNSLHAHEALDAESSHRTVVAGSGDDQRSVDGVGVHAGLIVVVHADKSPVGDDTGDTNALVRAAGDEVLNAGRVEQLDVGKLENLGQDGRGEQRSVLDNDVVALVLVRDTNVTEEDISRLAHNHSREELSSQPGTATGRHRGLDDGDLEVGTLLAEDVGSAQATGSSADDDDVGLSVVVQVLEVATGHSARDFTLADGSELEAVPLAHHLLDGLGGVGGLGKLDGQLLDRGGKLCVARGGRDGSGRSHDESMFCKHGAVKEGWKHDPIAGIIQI